MARLERFMNNLAGVDTKEHSGRYKIFYQAFSALFDCCMDIAKKEAPDGKNLDPANMKRLSEAYDAAIASATDYLRDKDREHDNPIYRRRYDTVEQLIEAMNEDRAKLAKKSADRLLLPQSAAGSRL